MWLPIWQWTVVVARHLASDVQVHFMDFVVCEPTNTGVESHRVPSQLLPFPKQLTACPVGQCKFCHQVIQLGRLETGDARCNAVERKLRVELVEPRLVGARPWWPGGCAGLVAPFCSVDIVRVEWNTHQNESGIEPKRTEAKTATAEYRSETKL